MRRIPAMTAGWMEGKGMDLWLLRPGHRIRTRDGAEAEVLAETEDGEWIKVRYLEAEDDLSLVGTEDLVSDSEVEALLGVVRRGTWGDKVIVMLHHIPEDEGFEGGYEADTVTGVPNNVKITGGDPDSKQGALDHLLGGLAALGFTGRVDVNDATDPGPVERYEIDIS